MITKHPLTPADIADRHRTLISAAFLLLGLAFAGGAVGFLAEETKIPFWIEHGGAAAGVGLILWSMLWKAKANHAAGRDPHFREEGYVAMIVTKAHSLSWAATFLLLATLKLFVDATSTLPTEFYVQFVLAVMLVTHSAAFFVMNRAEAGDVEGGHGA